MRTLSPEKSKESGTGISTAKWGLPLARPQRYDFIPEIIREIKAKSILEVGVYKGIHAKEMILAALETEGRVKYYGFDLFEDLTLELVEAEASPAAYRMDIVYDRLSGFGVDIELFKGDSKLTLPEFVNKGIKVDFIYIDGGHSPETVKSDWLNCEKLMHDNTVVVFDDYLEKYEQLGWGCNEVIDGIKDYKVEIIQPPDVYYLKKRCGSKERVKSKSWIVSVRKS